jgi:FlaA1/EpsC-like NDP-sugar epimerase
MAMWGLHMRGEPSGISEAVELEPASRSFLALDVLVVAATYVLVLVLRFNGRPPTRVSHSFQDFLPIAIVVHIAANGLAGLYRRVWRHASLFEVRRVSVAGFGSGVVLFAASFTTELAMPRSIIILAAVAVSVLLGGLRLFRPVSEMENVR